MGFPPVSHESKDCVIRTLGEENPPGFGSTSILFADHQGKVRRDKEGLTIIVLISSPLKGRNSLG